MKLPRISAIVGHVLVPIPKLYISVVDGSESEPEEAKGCRCGSTAEDRCSDDYQPERCSSKRTLTQTEHLYVQARINKQQQQHQKRFPPPRKKKRGKKRLHRNASKNIVPAEG